MIFLKRESDISCRVTLGRLHARTALEWGLEGQADFVDEGRALKASQVEHARTGVTGYSMK